MKSTPSNDISANCILAIRTSDPRFVNSFSICVTKALSSLSHAVTIVCDRRTTAMAWFLNHYECARCERRWTDEWSCMCDDECPHCGARDMTPYESEELTTLIERQGMEFVV